MAVVQMRDSPFALVISDVFMPDVNGFEFLMTVRDTFPRTRIIMISGGGISVGEEVGVEPTLSAAAKLGAARVLQKPFVFEELLDAVRALLVDDDPKLDTGRN